MRVRRSILSRLLQHFCLYFMLVSIALTVSVSLFTRIIEKTLGIALTGEQLHDTALATFLNIFVIASAFTRGDYLCYSLTVRRQIKMILDFTNELGKGNYGKHVKVSGLLPAAEYEEIIGNLNRLSDELNSVKVLREDFISNVSHEFKTPLAVIRNYAQLLEYDFKPEYISKINSTAERMTQLVSDILYLSKLESQQIYSRNEIFALSEVVRNVLIDYEDRIEEKNLTLDADIDEIEIRSDESMVSLLVSNLVSNAVKFTEKGKIAVSLHLAGDKAELKVADSGCGIDGDEIRHIFEKHYRANAAAGEGNGLGLAMVRQIANAHSFDISVISEPGAGTTFTILMPQQYNSNNP